MLIIDFDGTLVDIWNRYYKVFNDFWQIEGLELKDYMLLKKIYQYDDKILEIKKRLFTEKEYSSYKEFKNEKLEDIEYLKLDKLIASGRILREINTNKDIIILTIRNNRKCLIKQLNHLSIGYLEDKIICLNNNGIYTKRDWVERNFDINENKIIIGDSEIDYNIGTLRNTEIYLVRTGLRNPNSIIKNDNVKVNIIENIEEFWKIYNMGEY